MFLSLMLLQAIPVLHFFSSHKAVFYTYVDEEKPEQKSKIEKKATAEYLSVADKLFMVEEQPSFFFPYRVEALASPLLEHTTPPPNAC